jgi:Raf kinase inhibitor-like YbhB/YbcL family protein
MAIQVASPAFKEGAPIPPRFTCTEKDLSPALAWTGTPPGTKSFALICDDPDAPMGTWVHWVIFNLPADSTSLPEGVPVEPKLATGAVQGRNSWKKVGYGGPCPPPGKPHRYFFQLYALDVALTLDSNAAKKDLEAAMKGHVLAEGQLMGTYKR